MDFTELIDIDLIKFNQKALTDYLFFCEEVLGYKEEKRYGYKDLTRTHRELCSFLQDGESKCKLILMPRYSFKSELITSGYSLWRIFKDENVRILIYSDSSAKASGFLTTIKNHIEGKAANSRFRTKYGEWETDPIRGKWNDSQIIVKKRTVDFKEPTVDTGGIETSKVGLHYDIIIFDDIVSDLNVTTKAQMDKVHECYKKSLSLLKPGGEIIVVGTRWHFGDCYGRIIDENTEKNNFGLFIIDAEKKNEDGTLVFEEIGLNQEFLDYQRKEQGSYIYSCLYRNNPVDDETALFRGSNFRFYKPNRWFHDNMFVTGTLDPAGEGDDFSAITVVGTDEKRKMYVLDAVNKHMTPNQIIAEIIRLNYQWGFDRFSVERNFFKGMLEKDFRIMEEEHRKNDNYKPFSFAEDTVTSWVKRNFNRVLALQAFHERGDLIFPNKHDNPTLNTLEKVFMEMAFQMMRFTLDGSKSPHDDLLVALSMQTDIVRVGGVAKEEGPPENSPAWHEMRCYEEHLEINRRIPRRARENFEFIFN